MPSPFDGVKIGGEVGNPRGFDSRTHKTEQPPVKPTTPKPGPIKNARIYVIDPNSMEHKLYALAGDFYHYISNDAKFLSDLRHIDICSRPWTREERKLHYIKRQLIAFVNGKITKYPVYRQEARDLFNRYPELAKKFAKMFMPLHDYILIWEVPTYNIQNPRLSDISRFIDEKDAYLRKIAAAKEEKRIKDFVESWKNRTREFIEQFINFARSKSKAPTVFKNEIKIFLKQALTDKSFKGNGKFLEYQFRTKPLEESGFINYIFREMQGSASSEMIAGETFIEVFNKYDAEEYYKSLKANQKPRSGGASAPKKTLKGGKNAMYRGGSPLEINAGENGAATMSQASAPVSAAASPLDLDKAEIVALVKDMKRRVKGYKPGIDRETRIGDLLRMSLPRGKYTDLGINLLAQHIEAHYNAITRQSVPQEFIYGLFRILQMPNVRISAPGEIPRTTEIKFGGQGKPGEGKGEIRIPGK